MRVRILKGASSAQMFSVNAFFIGWDLVKGNRDGMGVVSSLPLTLTMKRSFRHCVWTDALCDDDDDNSLSFNSFLKRRRTGSSALQADRLPIVMIVPDF